MKNIVLNLCIATIFLFSVSCSEEDDAGQRVIPTMSLEVSDIANDMALITSEQLTGNVVSAKVIDFYPISEIGFDYNIEVKLVKFVEDNGVPVSLPYNKRIESGLRPGVDYMSAIIAYNEQGRAVCSAFKIWKASGTAGMWTDEGSAGNLEENNW